MTQARRQERQLQAFIAGFAKQAYLCSNSPRTDHFIAGYVFVVARAGSLHCQCCKRQSCRSMTFPQKEFSICRYVVRGMMRMHCGKRNGHATTGYPELSKKWRLRECSSLCSGVLRIQHVGVQCCGSTLGPRHPLSCSALKHCLPLLRRCDPCYPTSAMSHLEALLLFSLTFQCVHSRKRSSRSRQSRGRRLNCAGQTMS